MIRIVLLAAALASIALAAPGKAYTDPKEADADFAIQGEYVGQTAGKVVYGVQVVAAGNGKFTASLYAGGLPGAGAKKESRVEGKGETAGATTTINFEKFTAKITNSSLALATADGQLLGELKRIERSSPTLGIKPPEGAVVLFDGTSAEAFTGGKLSPEGWLMEGVTSTRKFGDCTLHIEFRTPYMPEAAGQARGNSGVYLQGRYEVQMLDSFGLAGKNNECGGIYTIKDPDINMCLPPLAWQSYDIDYTAARYDSSGAKTQNARITVRHNGVLIHENVELPKATTSAPVKEGREPGPVHLQNHGNPVRYRNIWLIEKQS